MRITLMDKGHIKDASDEQLMQIYNLVELIRAINAARFDNTERDIGRMSCLRVTGEQATVFEFVCEAIDLLGTPDGWSIAQLTDYINRLNENGRPL